jgi:2-oxoacid:acceptor oxidoreductase gamma subunit (pyruvate/2-ketoisovalerate family)
MLANAFVVEGRYASSIPSFGVERRGAPVAAFLRCDDKPIRDTHQVYDPECVVILDPSLARAEGSVHGLTGDGIFIVNTTMDLSDFYERFERIKVAATVDATGIALSVIGRPISNTCMLGAISRATGWVRLESVISSLAMYFRGEMLKRNEAAARKGYEELSLSFVRNVEKSKDHAL